jgi:plasmid stability protein
MPGFKKRRIAHCSMPVVRSPLDLIANGGDIAYNESMAVLNIRNLPDEVHARLRVRAARAGRSMEAEARAILAEAVAESGGRRGLPALKAVVDRFYSDAEPAAVVDELIAERRCEAAEPSGRLADQLDDIALAIAALPVLDERSPEALIGYDEEGLPG